VAAGSANLIVAAPFEIEVTRECDLTASQHRQVPPHLRYRKPMSVVIPREKKGGTRRPTAFTNATKQSPATATDEVLTNDLSSSFVAHVPMFYQALIGNTLSKAGNICLITIARVNGGITLSKGADRSVEDA
jgi:hypothetical protein